MKVSKSGIQIFFCISFKVILIKIFFYSALFLLYYFFKCCFPCSFKLISQLFIQDCLFLLEILNSFTKYLILLLDEFYLTILND